MMLVVGWLHGDALPSIACPTYAGPVSWPRGPRVCGAVDCTFQSTAAGDVFHLGDFFGRWRARHREAHSHVAKSRRSSITSVLSAPNSLSVSTSSGASSA